jgi:type II secretory pathway pseudopilin PulG
MPGDSLAPRVPRIIRVPRTPSRAQGQGHPAQAVGRGGPGTDEPDAIAPQLSGTAPAAATTTLSKSQFSSKLAELLIVLSIVVILTALALSNLDEILARIEMIRLVADMGAIDTAVIDYYAQRGGYPVDGGGIAPTRILVRTGALQHDPSVPHISDYRKVAGYWITGPDAKGDHYGANRAVVSIDGVLYDRDHVKSDLHW